MKDNKEGLPIAVVIVLVLAALFFYIHHLRENYRKAKKRKEEKMRLFLLKRQHLIEYKCYLDNQIEEWYIIAVTLLVFMYLCFTVIIAKTTGVSLISALQDSAFILTGIAIIVGLYMRRSNVVETLRPLIYEKIKTAVYRKSDFKPEEITAVENSIQELKTEIDDLDKEIGKDRPRNYPKPRYQPPIHGLVLKPEYFHRFGPLVVPTSAETDQTIA